MQQVTNNPAAATVEAVREHCAARVSLLASCARAATGLTNAATRWAYAEGRALLAGLTDRDAIQRAVCEKFPKLTGNGKPSKTPNSAFKTSYDKFALVADVMSGDHKTYVSDAAKTLAARFLADDNAVRDDEGNIVRFRMSLNDVVDQIKTDHSATQREARANETDDEKAARKAREESELIEQFAGTVAISPAMLNALAGRINGFGPDEAPLADALNNVAVAIAGYAERIAASEEKLAA